MNAKRFYFMASLVLGFFLGLFVLSGSFSLAQNPFDSIQFPIPELGGCNSFEECKEYCDSPANIRACILWANERGIDTSPGDVDDHEVEEFLEEGNGPGGCSSLEECDAFCSEPDNNITCIDFAEAEGFMTPGEAERARQHSGRREGDIMGPGGCDSRESCDAFCSEPENTRECVLFSVENDFMTPEEADRILRFLSDGSPDFEIPRGSRAPRGPTGPHIDDEMDIDIEKAKRILEELGGGPGGCQGFEACDVFCNTPQNDDVCMNFAIEHELIPPEVVERIQRIQNIIGPGGCRGRECEVYCEAPGHELECIEFAHVEGFMGDEEYREVKRFLDVSLDGGPGGCIGRECETFCSDPNHQDECFAFAKEHGLIPPEEIEMIEGLRVRMQSGGSPGGCRSEQECKAYCSDPSRIDECSAFAVDAGLMRPADAEFMMRQFIGTEHGDFGEFGDPRFAPPPGFEGEFDRRYEEEFERRMMEFESFRHEFEEGGFSTPDAFPSQFHDDFPEGDFPPPQEFPTQTFPQPSFDASFFNRQDFLDALREKEGFRTCLFQNLGTAGFEAIAGGAQPDASQVNIIGRCLSGEIQAEIIEQNIIRFEGPQPGTFEAGGIVVPEGFVVPEEFKDFIPPEDLFEPEPEPTSQAPERSFMGNIFYSFLSLFGI